MCFTNIDHEKYEEQEVEEVLQEEEFEEELEGEDEVEEEEQVEEEEEFEEEIQEEPVEDSGDEWVDEDDDEEENAYEYGKLFKELEALVQFRELLTERLVQDPFYRLMNMGAPSRFWMLRHLKHLAQYAEHEHGWNLLQYFKTMGRDSVMTFMQQKNAPREMLDLWELITLGSNPAINDM